MTYDKNKTYTNEQQSSGGFLAGVVLGGVIGAAVALLTSLAQTIRPHMVPQSVADVHCRF